MSEPPRRKATIDDFWAIPEAERFHEFRASEQAELHVGTLFGDDPPDP